MRTEIEQFIVNNYFELTKISKRITRGHELSNDLLNDVLLQLYEKEKIELKEYDDNSIKYYITAIMRINWNSKTSPFYYRYKKYVDLSQQIDDNYDVPDDFEQKMEREVLIQCLEISFAELDWFHKSVFELYMTHGSLKQVALKTGIPLTSIARYIKESKLDMKNKINNKLNGN